MKNQDQYSVTEKTRLNLVFQFMGAVKKGDRELISCLLTEDAIWVFPGRNVLSGVAKGIDAVANRAALINSYGISIEHTNSLYSLNGLGLKLHNEGRKDGLILDEFLLSAITFKSDKIYSIDTYLSDIPGMNAFFIGEPTGKFPPTVLGDELKYKIGNDFITALKTRDWGLMRSLLNDKVSWSLPGSSLLSGLVKGADQVISRASQLRDFGVKVEVERLLIGLNGVALSLHNTASRGELILDQQVVISCELLDGKITAIATHLHDVAGINAFFLEGIISKN
jgi:ketosteroid isomerase-like protein